MANNYSSKVVTSVINSVRTDIATNPTYFYVADGVSQINEPSSETEVTYYDQRDTLNKVLFGKRITMNNMHFMMRRVNWVSGTVYEQYDDHDPELGSKDFFVVASNRGVYKCISNNYRSPSTVEPSSFDPYPEKTVDGYVWQYLYRLTTNQLDNVGSSTLIPFNEAINDTEIPIPATVDRIDIVNPGFGYEATHVGSIINVVSPTLFQIDNTASSLSGIYNNSSLYISSGPGTGGISVIRRYVSNTSGRWVEINDPMPLVGVSSTYEINPTIQITGTGTGAKAKAVVQNGELVDVEVISPGSGYIDVTATVVANTGYGSGAVIRPIVSPIQGHGSDIPSELFCRNLQITVDFDIDEANTIPTDVSYCRYGLMNGIREEGTDDLWEESTFANIAIIKAPQINGNFQVGDEITNGTARATVVAVNGENVKAIYFGRERFAPSDVLTKTGTTTTATIQTIINPSVYLDDASILSIRNINTLQRSELTQETVTILLRF